MRNCQWSRSYDEPALNEFQRRVIRHEELAQKFQMEFPLYQNKQKAYDAAVDEFEHVFAQAGFAVATSMRSGKNWT